VLFLLKNLSVLLILNNIKILLLSTIFIYSLTINLTFFYIFFFYYIFILSFFSYILLKKNIKQFKTGYQSIFKDKEFILFKFNLFNLYYFILIIFTSFILKVYGLNIIFFSPYYLFILILLIILLTNNSFVLFLFNIYNKFNLITNEFKLENLSLNKESVLKYNNTYKKTNKEFKFNLNRQFSTYNNTDKNTSDTHFNSELNLDYENELDTKEVPLIKEQAIKEFKKTYARGYLGYSYSYSLGSVSHWMYADEGYLIKQYTKEIEIKLIDYLKDIPENITYSILPILRRELDGSEYQTITATNSIKITRFSNSSLLAERLAHALMDKLFVYRVFGLDVSFFILSRPWLNADDFNIKLTDVTKKLDKQLEIETYGNSITVLVNNKIFSDKVLKLQRYLYDDIFMDNYGDPILDKNKNLIGYKINENKHITIETFYNDENLLCNKIIIKEFNNKSLSFIGEPIDSWVDIRTESGFIREYNNRKYYYDKFNCITNVGINFSCPQFPLHKKDLNKKDKIGTLDFETYGTNLGMGHHQVYAAGFSIKGKTELKYIEPGETSENFINRFFYYILNNNKLDGYTIYAHNLGRFDSLFIIKALLLNKDVELIPIWKDNAILSLTLKHNDTKLMLLDSLQLIPGSLNELLESFNCKNKKGIFPYKAVNKKTLFFKGDKPSINLYENISSREYQAIPNTDWNLKDETLNYLKSDVEGLLEVVTKFKENIFNKYQLNIINYKTLPSLALAVYTSSYIPSSLVPDFKMVKGDLEQEIRSSYFGGNVDVFINEIDKGYYYDMNSQYPTAMLNDMPVGEPVLSLENDLNKIFGFVYGEIISPDESILQVPFIQYKDPIWKLNNCPRGKFKRLIFSEEIKYALKFGYRINIDYCYQFKRGKDLFKDYINDHYKLKSSTTDPVQKTISKLFLNSLYGRMGMKEIDNVLKIVNKKEADNLDRNTNVSIISELDNDMYMVRYNGKITDNLRKLYTKDLLKTEKNNSKPLSKVELRRSGFNKSRNVPSAVHIAAAISSYARILINEYKNIPGNPCIMSDTDSAVLSKPLPDHLVGKELGQMKLEQEISKGVFIKKKLYYLLNSKGQEIIKASGIDSNKLNYSSFKRLLNGETLVIDRTNFNVEWKTLNINVVSSKIEIQGLKGEVKTIYNTVDVNFKFLIVHPLFPLENIVIQDKENTILVKDNDQFILFSNFEIFFFLFTTLLFFIFIFIYILIFK